MGVDEDVHEPLGDALLVHLLGSRDNDAEFAQVIAIDAADIVPTVAFPHLPSNTRPVAEARDVKIDQAVIGSCTNGPAARMPM